MQSSALPSSRVAAHDRGCAGGPVSQCFERQVRQDPDGWKGGSFWVRSAVNGNALQSESPKDHKRAMKKTFQGRKI